MPLTDYYISDLHISPETEGVNALFAAFLDRDLKDARSLTINGDFFNYHVGYKQFRYPFYDAMGKRLAALVARGVAVDFVAGNRDFLLARDAKLYGMRGFKNSVTRTIGAQSVCAIHGDTFCLDDKAYLRFRAWMRLVPWHFINCVTPPAFGQMIGRGFRKKSIARQAADSKPRTYYDIKDEAVIPFLVKAGCDTLVCGHIHQPQERRYTIDGKARRLLVLSDWKPDSAIIARSVNDAPLEMLRLTHDGLAPWEHVVMVRNAFVSNA